MSRPGEPIPTGETVLWQWPSGWWERLRAGSGNWSGKSILVLLVGFGITVGTAYAFYVFLQKVESAPPAEPAGWLTVAVLFALAFVVFVGVPMAAITGIGCLLLPRLTLTEGAVRIAARFPWRRETSVPRAAIRSAVIHEGDGTVILLGRNGELLRARHVSEAAAFTEALAAPTLAWPVRQPSKAVDLLFGAFVVSFIVLIYVTMPAIMILLNVIGGEAIGYFGFTVGSFAGGMVMAAPLALVLVLAIGRRFVSPRTLDEFTARLVEPAKWRGNTPSWWDWLAKPVAACARLAARLAGIAPPPPLQPELRHGATQEIAMGAGGR